jgi:hypothetical protein
LGFCGSIAGEEEEEVGERVFLFCLLVTCSDGGDETEDREEGKGVVERKGDGWLQMCGQKFRGVICEE